MKEGVFWVIPQEAEQYSFEIISEFNGVLGHSDIWKKVICKNNKLAQYEYDFFPRGRVWIKDKKATIFLNPLINTPVVLQKIIEIFQIDEQYVVSEDI